ncbi:acyl-CoA synthetase (NDP forming) [Caldalkalibacillus uzonensis]|uniref:Acyl-CoA synthetase (NDP forming) n=1 Tax=Caldalkalibacillus uzonensis TaxID=353224 RepID=A0ABU0CWM8_9BACI|nr:CoA-binding protein [Caldalkalibacillus uzonensis]MDQ0340823.1 acyl-CoA synthetase (NDP forming) [Caldalkalibacillus uzonensis]
MNPVQSIEYLLNPSSIAVVGASTNRNKHGGRLIHHLLMHGYTGKIYPINPKADNIQGLTCFPSIKALPESVDLACLLISSKYLLKTMEECVDKKIKMVMIHSSGFAETGREGAKLQQQLVEYAKANGIRICGPNTIGITNVKNKVFASFSMSMTSTNIPVDGSISYITQSGAIGGAMLSQGWDKSIGINKWISSGNEADLDAADYIDYMVKDDSTRTICVFLEGIKDGLKLKRSLVKAANKRKPVIVFKNGRTEVGRKSVQSHTGLLAGNHKVYQAVFKQYGVIMAESLDDLFDFAMALNYLSLPDGKRVGVVSTSGGACTIVADRCIDSGLEVPDLTKESKERLKAILPDFGAPQNPFDTTAQILNNPEYLKQGLEVLINDPNIDAMILMLTILAGSVATHVAEDIIELSQLSDKPIIVAWTIAENLAKEGMNKLRKAKVPLYPSPERAVKSLQVMQQYKRFLEEWERKKEVYNVALLKNVPVVDYSIHSKH